MSTATINGKPVHPAVPRLAEEARAGKLSRREFLATATALGVTGPAAYGMLGLVMPTRARAQEGTPGGTIRISHDGDAPRRPAHLQLVAAGQPGPPLHRAAGALHRRLHLRAVADRELGSQRRRDGLRAEGAPGRDLEQRRRLQRRRRDLQPHPLVREPRAEQLDGDADAAPAREEGRGEVHGRRDQGRRHRRAGGADPRDLRGARRRDREGRRHDGPAQPRQPRHHHRAELRRLPGADRAPRLRRGRRRPHHRAGRHRAVGARLDRGRRARGLSEAHQRHLVGRRRARPRARLPRRRRVHRLRHRPVGRDLRLRVRRDPHELRDARRATSRSTTRSGW